MKKFNYKSYLAEFFGTFMLTFFGCATACTVGTSVEGGYFMTALAFGAVLAVLCFVIGPVSGCHVNPAVTLAMFINKKISAADAGLYALSQFIGGIAGGALLSLFFKPNKGLGANGASDDGIIISLLIEVILTAFFVLCVLGATSDKKNSSVAPVAVGASLTLVHIIGIHFTGTSVNPARSLGPAIFSQAGHIADVWIFIIAPLVGAVIAAFLWKFFKTTKD